MIVENMTMRRIYKNQDKEVFKDDETGITKTVYITEPIYKEELKKGVFLMPQGKSEREFLDRYPQWKKLPNGEMIDIKKYKHDRLEYEEYLKEQEHKENENWKTKLGNYKKVY